LNIYKPLLLLIICLLSQNIIPQKTEVIDSLWQTYKTSTNDSIKLKAGNYLAFHYIFRTPERADSILSLERRYAKTNKLHFNLTELTNTRGIYYDVLGQKDSSKVYFKRALNLSRKFQYPTIEVMCINNLGMFCWNNGQFKEAIDYFYQALEFSQKHNPKNDKGQSVYLNNIGLIYQELNQFEKAISYHDKALAIRKKYDLAKDVAQSYNNLAICHKNLGKLDEGLRFINLAIDFSNKANQPILYYKFHNNLGNILNLKKQFLPAIEAYREALNIPEDYRNYAKFKYDVYSNLIEVYYNKNELNKAKAIIQKAEVLLEQDEGLFNFSESYFINSAKVYYALQELNKADEFFESYITLKDSLFSEKNAKALANVEAKLKTKEKEAELAKAKSDLLERELEVRQKNLLFYGSLSAIIILIVIGYLVIKSKQLKNNRLKKEAELQTALAKIELKNQLEEQRLRISRDLHDNIGSQLTFVISGLQIIQHQKDVKFAEVKSKLEQLSQFTRQTINELRDTIWAMNKEEIQLSDLLDRLNKFVNQTNIEEKISITAPENKDLVLHQITFNAIEGIQIYRIIQEAVNNAVKHAEATQIDVKIDIKEEVIQLQISDDGKGFDVETVEFGNGLNNLKKRADQLHAILDVQSRINQGTEIKLTLPLT